MSEREEGIGNSYVSVVRAEWSSCACRRSIRDHGVRPVRCNDRVPAHSVTVPMKTLRVVA